MVTLPPSPQGLSSPLPQLSYALADTNKNTFFPPLLFSLSFSCMVEGVGWGSPQPSFLRPQVVSTIKEPQWSSEEADGVLALPLSCRIGKGGIGAEAVTPGSPPQPASPTLCWGSVVFTTRALQEYLPQHSCIARRACFWGSWTGVAQL